MPPLPGGTTEPRNAARRRLVAQLTAYLTWPEDEARRLLYLLQPMLPFGDEESAKPASLIAPGTSGSEVAQRELQAALEAVLAISLHPSISPDFAADLADAGGNIRTAITMLFRNPDDGETPPMHRILNAAVGLDDDGAETGLVTVEGRQACLNEITAARLQWSRAGYVLFRYCQMALSENAEVRAAASINNAIGIVAGEGHGPRLTKDAWRSHKSVAHLAAAIIVLTERRRRRLSSSPRLTGLQSSTTLQTMPNECLNLAAALQEFGLASSNSRARRRAPGSPSSKSVLADETTWRVPAAHSMKLEQADLPQLTSKHIDAALSRAS